MLAQASLAGLAERLEAAEKAGTEVAVLHLLCHGGRVGSSFGLGLDGEGGAVMLDAAQVRKQLAPFAHRVRLVVLSACDSGHPGPLGSQLGSVAQQLHRSGFQAVIASRYPLSVAGSIQLTETLYHQLLSGQASLEDAFLAVRKRLSREETRLPREQQRLDCRACSFTPGKTMATTPGRCSTGLTVACWLSSPSTARSFLVARLK